jgi:hypothetical protein
MVTAGSSAAPSSLSRQKREMSVEKLVITGDEPLCGVPGRAYGQPTH